MYKLFDRLEKAGFFGIDVDLEISLFEYNFIMRPTDIKGEYQVIFAFSNQDFPLGVMFDYGFIKNKDIKEFLEESWFDALGFLSFVGMSKTSWLKLSIQHKFQDLISYYAIEEFGFSCYYPISIFSLARTYKTKRGEK